MCICAPAGGCSESKNKNDRAIGRRKKFYDIFNHLDTVHKRDGRTDGQMDRQTDRQTDRQIYIHAYIHQATAKTALIYA